MIANIIQVGFFAGSILFLFITMIVVSAGWRKTCATFKNITKTQYPDLDFKCNGQQPHYLAYQPNGGEFIAAAVSQLIDKLLLIFS